jgi:hypothetical protein
LKHKWQKKRGLSPFLRSIKAIINNPSIGTEKKGDLKGAFVYKFKLIKTEYLLSYRIVGEDLKLITIGPHENYYRDHQSIQATGRSAEALTRQVP